MGRIKNVIGNNGQQLTMTYDNNGNLKTTTDAANRTTTYGYDVLNRVASTTAPDGGVTQTQYDADGNVSAAIDPQRGTWFRRLQRCELVQQPTLMFVVGAVVKHRVFGWIVIVCGVAVALYGLLGVIRYGFYLSGRWSLGQTEGGLAPLFLLIGLLGVAYGAIELRLRLAEPRKRRTPCDLTRIRTRSHGV